VTVGIVWHTVYWQMLIWFLAMIEILLCLLCAPCTAMAVRIGLIHFQAGCGPDLALVFKETFCVVIDLLRHFCFCCVRIVPCYSVLCWSGKIVSYVTFLC